MISIIICSRKSSINPDLEYNIQSTIGVDHEIIIVNNENNHYSITQAYNIGVYKSKYEFLCFMHDDILYNGVNWGNKIVTHFQDITVAVLAVAGSPFHSSFPGSWFSSKILNIYLLQGAKDKESYTYVSQENNISNNNQVVSFDGCWFCVRKEVFSKVSFDEKNFKGFHFYEADLAMQISRLGKRIITIKNILVTHLSTGSTNIDYIESALMFQRKWAKFLPNVTPNFPKKSLVEAEFKVLDEFIWVCSINGLLNKLMWAKILTLVLKKRYTHRLTFSYILRSLKVILK
jgi:hypothetical protein